MLDSPIFAPRRREYPEVGTPEIRMKIAKELKSARDFHEMTLDQISSTTKINITYLDNLESGKWNFLPAVYVKMFIKAFAEAVGILNEEFNNRLNEMFASLKPIANLTGEPISYTGSLSDRMRKNVGLFSWAERNRAILFYSALTVLVLAVIGYYLLRMPQQDELSALQHFEASSQNNATTMTDTPKVAPAIAPVTVPVNEAQTSARTVQAEANVTGSLDNKDKFRPMFVANDYCYLRIEEGDSILYDKTLWPGNRLNDEFPYPIKVVLGNAPAMTIVVNNDTLPKSDPSVKVKTIMLGPAGIVTN